MQKPPSSPPPVRLLGAALVVIVVAAAWWFSVAWAASLDPDALLGQLDQLKSSGLAPLAVVVLFCLLGLAGAPQFALIFAVTLAFGPFLGALYAWGATLTSALLGYLIGARLGFRVVHRFGGARIGRVSQMLGRRGMLASALIRLVPSGPFVVVNVLAGASHVRPRDFALGTALGIVPKIVLIAGISSGTISFIDSRDPKAIAIILGCLAAWVILAAVLRERFRSRLDKPALSATE